MAIMKNGARQAEFKGGRQAAGRGCADMGKKSKGVFLSLDAVTAMLLLFVVIIISFAYFTVPMTSNFESQLLRMQMQDAATVMSKAGYLPLSLDSSSDAGISGIREVLRATPDSLCVQVSAYGTKQPEGLVGHWKLDESSDSPAVVNFAGGASASRISDYAGTITSKQFGVDESGISGKAMSFNGAECFAIPFTAPTSTHPESFTRLVKDDFTISFWVKTRQNGGGNIQWWQGTGLVDGYVSGGSSDDFGISLLGDKAAFGFSTPQNTIQSASAINDGKWHHVAATASRATGRTYLFFDGVSEASGIAANFSIKDVPRLAVGCRQDEANYFEGSIDELRIYDRVLSAAEIRGLYANPTGAEYVVTKPGCVRQQGAAVQSITIPFIDSRSGENVQYTALLRAWSKSPLQTDTSLLGGLLTQFENITNVSNATLLCGSGICNSWETCCSARTPNYCYNPSTAVCDACGGVCDPSAEYCNETTGACESILDTNGSIVGGCMVLSQPDTTYILSSDVVSADGSTCFNVTAPGVTLDCQGHSISTQVSTYNFPASTVENYGVYSDQTDTTVDNCVITGLFYTGIRFEKSYWGIELDGKITDVSVNSTHTSIFLYGSNISVNNANLLSSSGLGISSTGLGNSFTRITVSAGNVGISSSGGSTTIADSNIYSGRSGIVVSGLGNSISNSNATTGIIHGTMYPAIDFTGSGNITNIRATSSGGSGIRLNYASNNTVILDSIAESVLSDYPDQSAGIHLDGGVQNARILNSTAIGNDSYGILITGTSGSPLLPTYNNEISGTNVSSLSRSGIKVDQYAHYTRISDSIASSLSSRGIELDGLASTVTASNVLATSNSSQAFYLLQGYQNNISNVTAISNTGYALFLGSSHDNNFSNFNAISGTNYAIYSSGGYRNNLSNFTAISNTSNALYLSSSSNNTLFNFTAISNTSHAFYLYSSSNNRLVNFGATTYAASTSKPGYALYIHSNSGNNVLSNFNATSTNSSAIMFLLNSNNNSLSNFGAASNAAYYTLSLASDSNNNALSNFTSFSERYGAIGVHSYSNTLSNFNATSNTNSSYKALVITGSNNTLSRFNATSKESIWLSTGSNNTISNFTAKCQFVCISLSQGTNGNFISNFNISLENPITYFSSSAMVLSDTYNNIISNFNLTTTRFGQEKGIGTGSNAVDNVFSNFTVTTTTSWLAGGSSYPNSRNNRFSNFNHTGHFVIQSDDCQFSNFNIFSNSTSSLSIEGSNNVFSSFNASTTGNTSPAIYLFNFNNTLSNFTAYSATTIAIHLNSANRCIITNFTSTSGTGTPIQLYRSHYNNISRGTLISGNGEWFGALLKISESSDNIFYWNNFTDTNGRYVDQSSGSNFYNTTISGYGEGNIWYNVMNGSVAITGATAPRSAYDGVLKRGISGTGYPYNATTSQGKVSSGVVDRAPLRN